jgi:protein-L-isoaspartate(D-aspartate) O-methyltransferase
MIKSGIEQMKKLVNKLVKDNYIQSDKVFNTMLAIDRADFTDLSPYEDCPQSINYAATISAPHMHAYVLEVLKDHLKPGNTVLDVGFGSGYLCAAFSKMMSDSGTVVGIEHIPELVEQGTKNLEKNYSNLLKENKIILITGDGRLGCEKYSKYDCIHVGASADVIHESLVDQLKNNGRLVIPVGKQTETQYINIVDKDEKGKITVTKHLGVRYVPLTSKDKQLNYYN